MTKLALGRAYLKKITFLRGAYSAGVVVSVGALYIAKKYTYQSSLDIQAIFCLQRFPYAFTGS